MTSEEYLKLYEKYESGNCSPEEIKMLMEYFSQFRMQESDARDSAEDIRIKHEVYKRIEVAAGIPKKVHKMPFYWWWAAAVLLLAVAAVFIVSKRPFVQSKEDGLMASAQRIKPAGPVATLTLADGSVIELGNVAKGILSKQGAVNVRKLQNGELVYENELSDRAGVETVYNTLSIPRGGYYQVVLSDGTKVWLNAESSLNFPTEFRGAERRVELVGEAYFEVSENKKMPFKVVSRETEVKVLGTHFNVRSYPVDELVRTTLLEGSVRLSTATSAIILKPGEQGYNAPGSEIAVKKVKKREVIGWKSGLFVFRNEDIREIMNQISRWYNVEISYEGEPTKQLFGGIYSKKKDLLELLNGLELTGLVHFKLEGRRVIVMK